MSSGTISKRALPHGNHFLPCDFQVATSTLLGNRGNHHSTEPCQAWTPDVSWFHLQALRRRGPALDGSSSCDCKSTCQLPAKVMFITNAPRNRPGPQYPSNVPQLGNFLQENCLALILSGSVFPLAELVIWVNGQSA